MSDIVAILSAELEDTERIGVYSMAVMRALAPAISKNKAQGCWKGLKIWGGKERTPPTFNIPVQGSHGRQGFVLA